MRYLFFRLFLISSFLLSCSYHDNKGNKNLTDKSVGFKLFDISQFSKYIFMQRFNNIKKDSIINNNFNIIQLREESEGVEWDIIYLKRDRKVYCTIENNWEDSSFVTRVSFYDPRFYLNNGITTASKFRDVVKFIKVNDLNSSNDGSLAFIDSVDSTIVYYYDISNDKNLYYGIKSLKDVPDSLHMTSIVVNKK
ncbi:MAG: hypothetical protein QM731_02070 [Chitinophagaceae bacterium]